MPGRLTVHLSNLPARRLYVEEGSDYVIGRGAECDLQINHPQLSRRHARLSWQDDSWEFSDLGSKNGLVVNGRKVETSQIGDDGWVQFGDVVARFEMVSNEARQREDELNRRRWETSLELRRQLDPAAGLDRLLHQVLRSVLSLSGTERGFVMLTTDTGDLEIKSYSGVAPDDFDKQQFSGSVGAIEIALGSGNMVVSGDAMTDAQLGSRPSITIGEIRALVCIPLVILNKTTGILYADSREPGKVFTELDVEILQGLANHAGMAIAVARIRDEIAGLGRALPDIDPGSVEQNDSQLEEWADHLPGFEPDSTEADNDGRGGVTWSDLKAAHTSKSGSDT